MATQKKQASSAAWVACELLWETVIITFIRYIYIYSACRTTREIVIEKQQPITIEVKLCRNWELCSSLICQYYGYYNTMYMRYTTDNSEQYGEKWHFRCLYLQIAPNISFLDNSMDTVIVDFRKRSRIWLLPNTCVKPVSFRSNIIGKPDNSINGIQWQLIRSHSTLSYKKREEKSLSHTIRMLLKNKFIVQFK
jgi:hypothetical protein